ncbi:MAG: ATP-binding protein [Sedimenticola sp.]
MDKKRHLEQKVNQLLGMFPLVAILGARQCGKSTFVQGLRPHWKYYDLESPDHYQLISSDPVAFFAVNDGDLIIDEAQQYPEIFRVLRGVIDRDRKRKGRFILTGSSSPDIVSGITESLAGRIATIEMSPFKQSEFYERLSSPLYRLIAEEGAAMSDFASLQPQISLEHSMHLWLKGGFPEPLIESESNDLYYSQWMENYISSYVERDIRTLFPRLNLHSFKRFLTLLAQFSGHQLNMSSMARSLEVSVPTIKEYLEIIHQTFLWRNLSAYEKNTLKKVQKSKKGLFRDQGVLHHLLRIKSLDSLLLHPVAGVSFESFVIEELIRGLHTTMATRLAFSYYRTIDKSEVDLIMEGDFGTIPVEIKLNSIIKPKALLGLKNFISDTGAHYGIVVNRGMRIEQLGEQIIQIPVHYL